MYYYRLQDSKILPLMYFSDAEKAFNRVYEGGGVESSVEENGFGKGLYGMDYTDLFFSRN